MFSFIPQFFGSILKLIYDTIAFQNYGFALILFTILTRLIMFPLSVKQLKSQQKMQELQPDMDKIKQRYKNDKEKQQQEMMKLYQEKGYNPAGGCLPMLLQFPIMIALYSVIRRPLTYMLGWTKNDFANTIINIKENQPEIIESLPRFQTALENVDITQSADLVVKAFDRNTSFEIDIINIVNSVPEYFEQGLETIKLTFLRIFDLGVIPTINFEAISKNPGIYIPAIILVLLSAVVSYFSSRLLTKTNAMNQNKQQSGQMNQMGKSMMYFGPIMSLFIGFQIPLGLSLYWFIGNIIQLIQQVLLNKLRDNKKEEK